MKQTFCFCERSKSAMVIIVINIQIQFKILKFILNHTSEKYILRPLKVFSTNGRRMTMYLGTGNANLLPVLLTKMSGFLPGDVSDQAQRQVAISSFSSVPNTCEKFQSLNVPQRKMDLAMKQH